MARLNAQMKAKPAGKISALIISPTRELASQIAVEAEQLGKFHNITVQVGHICYHKFCTAS